MSSFFNSIGLDGNKLNKAVSDADSQEDKIYIFFTLCPTQSFTPFEILRCVNLGENVPITSVRRAMSNLEKKGLIEKVGKREGEYGMDNYTWRLKQ